LDLKKSFSTYAPISLSGLDEVALMDRREEKFVIPDFWCAEIATQLDSSYKILEIEGRRSFRYDNLYFDTPDNITLEDHIRGRKCRYKVRIRSYVSSNLTFLEVKKRSVHGRSVKRRIKRSNEMKWDAPLTTEEREFIHKHVPFGNDFQPALYSRYSRFTLASIERRERITFDTSLEFTTIDGTPVSPLTGLNIVELKQSETDRRSPLHKAFKSREDRINPLGRGISVSKYVIGRLHSDESISSRTYLANLKKLKRAADIAIAQVAHK
jgi:hypothetical protein